MYIPVRISQLETSLTRQKDQPTADANEKLLHGRVEADAKKQPVELQRYPKCAVNTADKDVVAAAGGWVV